MKMSEYLDSISNDEKSKQEESEQAMQETAQETIKKKRGRPRKQTVEETSGSKETSTTLEETVKGKETVESEETVTEIKETKRGRGRPKKDPKDKYKQHPVPPAAPTTNYRNSPVIGNNGLQVQEGDNAKFAALNKELFEMSNIDMNDVSAVEKQLAEYFAIYDRYDLKPTVAGMAAILGMDRRTLVAIINNRATGSDGYLTTLRPEVTAVIKKAYRLLENNWENYMNQGKINPVSGIFLAKNNYGYVDKQETVITPAAPAAEDYSADEIRERYIPSDSPIPLLPQSD